MGLLGEVLWVAFTLVFEVFRWLFEAGALSNSVEESRPVDSGLRVRLRDRVRAVRMPDADGSGTRRSAGEDSRAGNGAGLGVRLGREVD